MELGSGGHTGTATNRSNGLLHLPSFFILCKNKKQKNIYKEMKTNAKSCLASRTALL